ncbi:hypothetical protein D3C80_1829180 [compost metagenome]
MAAAAKIAFCQSPEAGIRLFMLINLDQQQRGITHQQPQSDQQTQRDAKADTGRRQWHRQHPCANGGSCHDKNTAKRAIFHVFLYQPKIL